MAEKILMLALSPTMETGIISKWLKQEGDAVASGDVICEVETDKATMDYESSAVGVLLKIVLPAGASAQVGDLIAVIGKSGEDISQILAAPGGNGGNAAGTAGNDAKPALAEPAAPTAPAASAEPAAAESPEAVAAEQPGPDQPSQDAVDSQESGQAVASGFIRSSPLARKIARQHELPLDGIKGSGPAGRIVKADVEKALATPAAQPAPSLTVPQSGAGAQQSAAGPAAYAPPTPQDVVTPVSGKRRIIAQRLSESMFSAPHYYLKVPVEMDAIMASRSRLNTRPDTKVSVNAFLIKFVAEALKKHPIVNATWTGDTIIQHGRIDIGLAVAQKDGLITPVVRDCGNKGIVQIENELKDLIQKARNNSLKPEEYTGATFTISNLGSYGVEEFTAIINPPGSAILAVGEIRREPVVQKDDAILIKSIMKMTLSCDHRVIDGSAGAAFITELRDMLEEPVRTLY